MRAATKPTTIAVVGGVGLFRAGIASLLERVGLGRTVEAEALHALPQRLREAALPAPGLVLMEAEIGAAGLVCGDARRLLPAARLVVLCDAIDGEALAHCRALGVDGYLLKDIGPDALADGLRRVLSGRKVFPCRPEAVAEAPAPLPLPRLEDPATSRLSERERDVLRCIATGDSNKLIARRLGIAEATVKVHLKAVLRKLGVANRTQAAVFALAGGRPPAWRTRRSLGPLHVTSIHPLEDEPLLALNAAQQAAGASGRTRNGQVEHRL